MGVIQEIINRIGHDVGSIDEIIAMLFVIFVMSLYEFLVYKFLSHKSMYNKSFHISIMIIPFFIGAIVMALQSNLVITLGTIGALAIIRFRTAIKDPVDMIYILWSIFIGITCGCKLYELCVLTSLMVTIVMVLINVVSSKLLSNPFYVVVNSNDDIELEIVSIIKSKSKNYKLKSKNYSKNGFDYVFEVDTKQIDGINGELLNNKKIKQYSIINFDSDDVI